MGRDATQDVSTSVPDDTVGDGRVDDLDRDELIEQHGYLVKMVLARLSPRLPRHTDWDDLWAAGQYGLVDASRRYRPEIGVPFAPYAMTRIRGAVLDAARSVDWASRGLRRDLRAINAATERLEQATGASATLADVAHEAGMSLESVERRRREALAISPVRLDAPTAAAGENGPTVGAQLADDSVERDPEGRLEHTELVGVLRTAVTHLPAATREVLVRHYFHGEKLCGIAASLAVTEARVSQLHAEGINALRAFMATEYDTVPDVPAGAPGMRRRSAYVASMAAHSALQTRLEAGRGITAARPASTSVVA
jgi:RNA polymerase sigma factor for flagellar operon FliA